MGLRFGSLSFTLIIRQNDLKKRQPTSSSFRDQLSITKLGPEIPLPDAIRRKKAYFSSDRIDREKNWSPF
jgi:hypothetical protein